MLILVISTLILTINKSKLDQWQLWSNDYANSTFDSKGTPLLSWEIAWENNGTAICTANNQQYDPQICTNGVEGVIITWWDNRSGSNYDIYAQKVNSTGYVQWTRNGTAICTASGIQRYPQICSDGVGGAIIAWYDQRGSDGDIYAQRVNSTGNVTWTTDGVAICTAGHDQKDLQICSDGEEGAIITWRDYRSSVNKIYTQRINSTGNVTWTTNGVAICTASGYQEQPQICSDGIGGALISWSDGRGIDTDIYVQRINSTGNLKWTTDGIALCTASNEQYYNQICSDGAEGAVITWVDLRNGIDLDIYTQRVNSTGHVQWTGNGSAICTAINHQEHPKICGDGEEGAIITWQDQRSGQYIYAQRVNSTGDIQWIGNGTAIWPGGSYQIRPEICSDEAGGAIITWDEWPINNYDVYVQRINSNGVVQWTADGVALCTADDNQYYPKICSDGTGGAVITWMDWRNGESNRDIYSQRITDDPPTSNHPGPITTYLSGSETIDWTLYDDYSGGQYRVWANDTNDNYYVWVDWTPWINDTSLSVPINRTALGIYNYTIQYNDSNGKFGVPDTVIVSITEPSNGDGDGNGDGEPGPIISGYNILILFLSASAISVILTRKFKKDRNRHENY